MSAENKNTDRGTTVDNADENAYNNPAYDDSANNGQTTVFGRDSPVTTDGEIFPPPPNYQPAGRILTHRNQYTREEKKSVSESIDPISDIEPADDDEDDEDGDDTPRRDKIRTSRSANYMANNNVRRVSQMGRRASVWSIDHADDEAQKELILKIRKHLPLKDFTDEIRAHRDLAKFLVQPVVLLDLQDTSLESIIEKLMEKLQKDLEIDEKITSRAGKAFFTKSHPGFETLASVDQLRETIQGVKYANEGTVYEETWITTLCSLPMLKRSHVAIARLRHPLNLGNKCEEVSFVIAIVAPKKEKFTKNAVEVGRTFSSLMSNIYFRKRLSDATTEQEFKQVLKEQSENYITQARLSLGDEFEEEEEDHSEMGEYPFYHFGRGVYNDIKRRLPHYISDYKDGIVGKNTLRKVISTTLFLYFACLLPDIAFGRLYEENTKGQIDVTSCIISQTLGGLTFALVSGQPLLVLLTTAPLALYVKVIYMVSDVIEADFLAMYAAVGLWNAGFLLLQGCLHASKLMKYSTRSTEEIFAFFIAIAFVVDAVKSTIERSLRVMRLRVPVFEFVHFYKNYNFDEIPSTVANASNITLPKDCLSDGYCARPENSILFMFLMLGTFVFGLMILRFEKSQFLSSNKREMLADYALPISVITFSFIGSYAFRQINLEQFHYDPARLGFRLAPITTLSVTAIIISAGLGLCLSCLFFVDQNVSAVLVNSPANKLQKGSSYHWDLVVVGFINAVLSIFNLPWLHAALPHSPLHVRALADVEQHITTLGTVHDQIVKVRETRLTTILSHILIGLSLLGIQYLRFIPIGVLQGLFLYLGVTSFDGNQLFDRLLLFFTEGSSYPPNHYVRKVPQRKLHIFTLTQIVQLLLVCGFGFAPQFYLKMIFPVLILLLLPVRHKLLPILIEPKYLAVLDSNAS